MLYKIIDALKILSQNNRNTTMNITQPLQQTKQTSVPDVERFTFVY